MFFQIAKSVCAVSLHEKSMTSHKTREIFAVIAQRPDKAVGVAAVLKAPLRHFCLSAGIFPIESTFSTSWRFRGKAAFHTLFVLADVCWTRILWAEDGRIYLVWVQRCGGARSKEVRPV